MAIALTVNGQPRSLDVEPDTPPLWALRDTIGLTGTTFGCGVAQCGACTVLVDGDAITNICRCGTFTRVLRAIQGLARS